MRTISCVILAFVIPFQLSQAQLSGSYTVGGESPDFATPQSAADALQSEGVSGPVQILLRPGVYGQSAPEELVLSIPDTIPGTSPVNRVTFEPDMAAGGTVTNVVLRMTEGASFVPASIVRLGTSYVTLRSITIENADVVGTRIVPPLLAIQQEASQTIPTSTSIEGCRFIGRSDSTTSSAGVIVSGPNSDILVAGNEFSGGYHGVLFEATNSIRPRVLGNSITGIPGVEQTNTPNNGGIVLGSGSVDAVVDGNIVDFEGTGGGVYGIHLANAQNFTVTSNRVLRFPNRGGLGPLDSFWGIQIQLLSAASKAAGGMVANNMVAGIRTGNRWGIHVTGDNVRVLHNSVYHTRLGIVCSRLSEAGIWITGTGHVVKNNFIRDETLYCSNSAALVVTDTTGNVFDSNNILGPETGVVLANGTEYFSIEQWQDNTSFGDSSISKLPSFVSASDLHLAECSVADDELRGVSEPTITIDIDGDSRDPTAPFIGADEAIGELPAVFDGPGVYAAGIGSFQFDSGDLDGDGDIDIVVTNPGSAGGGSGDNDVTVLYNNGNGNFGAPSHVEFGVDPNNIRIGEINGRGNPDLVVRGDDGVWVRFGVPGGSFTDAFQVNSLGTSDLELADYDNDGDTDIFVVSSPPGGSSTVVVFINDGGGVFSGLSNFEVISTDTVTDVELADVNSDGFVDVVAGEATGAGKFVVLENLGVQAPGVSAGFADAVEYAFSVTSDPARSRFAVGDFDGDLDVDAILGSAAGGDSLVFIRNNGDGHFGDRQAFDVHHSGVPEVVASLDYERDGDLDLVVASSLSTVNLLLNSGDGSFERVILCDNGALAGFPIGITTGLFDGDNSTDVAVLTFDGAVDGRVEVLYNLEWRPSGVAIDAPGEPDAESSLSPNYPNPFVASTTIPFKLVRNAHVELTVFDLLGRKVATALDDIRPAGKHVIRFDASGFASGIYFYRISAGDFSETRRMLIVR